MERQNKTPGFVDVMTASLGGPKTSRLLDQLDAAVPWETLAEPIRSLYRSGEHGGRRPWPAVMMLKCLMLSKWFGLSDPQLEEALQDRLSFRRFVGLALDDDTPDETTFVTFRRRLREAKLQEYLFQRTVKHLDTAGLLVKDGTLVDATIFQASRGQRRPDGTSTRDEDASFTKKHGTTHHGYKGHVAADRSGIVTKYDFSTAKDHDSKYIDALIEDETFAVFADSAYMSRERSQRLRDRGVIDGIMRRRVRGQAELEPVDQVINAFVPKVRARVEHIFAWLRQMGHHRVRYRGRDRNACDFALLLIAYNFKRSLHLASA